MTANNTTINPCGCGCGEDAGYYKSSNRKLGIVKGAPKKYVRGHHNALRKDTDPCSVPGCDKERYANGVCQPHYDRMRTRGTYDDPEGLVFNQGRECSVVGCDRTEHTKGMCEPHYRRVRKYGTPHAGRIIVKRRDLSMVPEGHIWCSRCNEIKSVDQFNKGQKWCMICLKEWRTENAASVREANSRCAKRKYQEAKDEGRCAWRSGRGCDSPAAPRRVYCDYHGTYDAARSTVDYSANYLARGLTDCWICGTPFSESVKRHNDHLIPQSKGGPDDVWNFAPACEHCNTSRGNEDLSVTIKRAVHGIVAVSDFPEEYTHYIG